MSTKAPPPPPSDDDDDDAVDEEGKESFPGSDPPGTGGPGI